MTRAQNSASYGPRHKIWSVVAFSVVIAGIVLFFIMKPHFLRPILHITLSQASLLVVTSLICTTINGLFLKELTSKFGVNLSIVEWFGLSVVTTLGNYITPFSGGMIARAAYLKQRHSFSYSKFMSVLAANYLVIFWMIGMAGTVILVKWVKMVSSVYVVLVFFILVVGVISIFFLFPSIKSPGDDKSFFVAHINEALSGWDLIRKDAALLFTIVVYTAVNIAVNGLSFWIAYSALGAAVPFTSALLVSLFISFSLLINVTPGNIGVQEAIVGLSSGLLGLGAGLALVAAILVRASALLVAFTLGPIFSVLLSRKLRSS
jgi:uncharacterized membrane protein YbhN (UPF0104 family)